MPPGLESDIAQWERHTDTRWPLPHASTAEALLLCEVGTDRLSEVYLRYLGVFYSAAGVALELARASNPSVDFDTWPFTHIDWEDAAVASGIGVAAPLAVIDGVNWFDMEDSALYAESPGKLDEIVRARS